MNFATIKIFKVVKAMKDFTKNLNFGFKKTGFKNFGFGVEETATIVEEFIIIVIVKFIVIK